MMAYKAREMYCYNDSVTDKPRRRGKWNVGKQKQNENKEQYNQANSVLTH